MRTIELVPQPADLQPEGGFICLHLGGRSGLMHLGGGTQARDPKVRNLKLPRTGGAGGRRETAVILLGPQTCAPTSSHTFLPET